MAHRDGVGCRVGKRAQWHGVGLLEGHVTESGALHKGSGSVHGESLSYLGSILEREIPQDFPTNLDVGLRDRGDKMTLSLLP